MTSSMQHELINPATEAVIGVVDGLDQAAVDQAIARSRGVPSARSRICTHSWNRPV